MKETRSEKSAKRRAAERRRWLMVTITIGGLLAAAVSFRLLLPEGGISSLLAGNQKLEQTSSAQSDPLDTDLQLGKEEQIEQPEQKIASNSHSTGTKDKVTFAFVGDILLGSRVGALMEQHGYDYPYTYVSKLLQEPDVAAGNLETPVSDIVEKLGKKQYEFRSSPKALPSLKAAGFDVLSLANNHTFDMGAEGLRDTIKHLDAAGIRHTGAGSNADEAFNPVIVEKNGVKIAFIALSHIVPSVDWKAGKNNPGVAETYNNTRALEEIKGVKKKADLVVVFVHWGEELKEQPVAYQKELGRKYIDSGADLVIGSHPHVLQGVEHYNGRWIAYSLGNFIFTTSANKLTHESAILQAECTKGGECRLKFIPVNTASPQPIPMTTKESKAVLQRLDALSVGASVGLNGQVTVKPGKKA